MNSYLRANLLNALVLALNATCVNSDITTTIKPRLVPYSIPENRELKKLLGYNEDTYLNFTELTTKYGYPFEEHSVTTEDGYVLTVFRILPKCSEVTVMRQHPVLLLHGLMDSSDLWILSGPKTGLGYILANNCYDVWAANLRGNRYSRKHVRLDPNTDKEYWNFSFDENGNYDLPAIVDYILKTTKRLRLNFIGHSQGTTDFFVMSSLRPDYNDKIGLSIHLAPVAWLGHLKSPAPAIASFGIAPLRAILESAGYSEFVAYDQILHSVLEFLCQKYPEKICGTIFTLTTGYKSGTIRSETLAIAFGHLLVGSSTKNLVHYGQLIRAKKFRRFDEGRTDNIKRYGVPRPPNYNVSRITSPVVLINAYNDWISTLEDNRELSSRLPNVIEDYIVPKRYWSHHSHVWGIKAPTFVFPKILYYLNRYDYDAYL